MIYLELNSHMIEQYQYAYYIYSEIINKYQEQAEILNQMKQFCSMQKSIQINENIDFYIHKIMVMIYMYNKIDNVLATVDKSDLQIHKLFYKNKLSLNKIAAKTEMASDNISKVLFNITELIKNDNI